MKALKKDYVTTIFIVITFVLFLGYLFSGWDVSFFLLLVLGFEIRWIVWQEGYLREIENLREENEFLRKYNK